MIKRLLCLLMMLCMVVSLLPTWVLAEDVVAYAGEPEETYGKGTLSVQEESILEVSLDEVLPSESLTEESSAEKLMQEESSEEPTVEQPAQEEPADEEQVSEIPAEEAAIEKSNFEETSEEPAEEADSDVPVEESPAEQSTPETSSEASTDVAQSNEAPTEELLILEDDEELSAENLAEDPDEESPAKEQNAEETVPEEPKENNHSAVPEEADEKAEQADEPEKNPRKELVAEEEESKAEKKDAVQQNLNSWTLKTIDDTTINQNTYKTKVQLLVFYKGRMQNGKATNAGSGQLISELAGAWWTSSKEIQVIAVESDDCTKAETKAFKKAYAPGSKNIVFAYGGSELMHSAIKELEIVSNPDEFLANPEYREILFPSCMILKDGTVCDFWCMDSTAVKCEVYLKQYADLGTNPNMNQTRVEGRFNQTEARRMFKMVNEFRTARKMWYWNEDDKTKTVLNTKSSNTLFKLSYDYDLEQIAMKRAQEIAVHFDHRRPNGDMCYSLSVNGTSTCGENIAYGTSGYMDTNQAFSIWREDNEDYYGQGHRRNMLREGFTSIGIGCYISDDGNTYWTQEFGYDNSGAAKTDANDSASTALIEYNAELVHNVQPYKLDALEKAVISRTSYGEKGITIQWNEIFGATSYQVSKRVKGGTWKSLGTATGLSFTDPNVDSGKTYQYRVRAKNSSLT